MKKCSSVLRTIKNIILILLILVVQFMLIGCNKIHEEPISNTIIALDTVVSITIYDSNDKEILDEALGLVEKYESIFSKTLVTSELYRLNNREITGIDNKPYSYEISDELSEVINYGLKYSEISNGSFDITVEPLTSLWDFKSEDPKPPDEYLINTALNQIGYEDIELNGKIISLKEETTRIELGGIAKGYIADKVAEYLYSNGIRSALIDLGGNILCIGEKPKGQPFKIGIQKPFADRNETIAIMDIKDRSVVTSGVYERYFYEGEKIYHHILNPKTGFPYDNNLISVTIVSKDSIDGDVLSTTCFALGLKAGLELINNLHDTHAIFITNEYEFYYSDGFFEDIDVREIKQD